MSRAVAVPTRGLSYGIKLRRLRKRAEKISSVQEISVAKKSYYTTLADDHCSLSASTEAPCIVELGEVIS